MSLIVFTYTGEPRETGFGGTFVTNDASSEFLTAIGTITGYDGDDLEVYQKAEKALSEVGQVTFMVFSTEDDAHYRGALLAPALVVKRYDLAQDIEGFEPFFHHTGFFFVMPELNPGDGVISRHDYAGRLPRYSDGVFACSMIPRGQIGTMVFFEEDPLHVYVNRALTEKIQGATEAVGKWRKENPL